MTKPFLNIWVGRTLSKHCSSFIHTGQAGIHSTNIIGCSLSTGIHGGHRGSSSDAENKPKDGSSLRASFNGGAERQPEETDITVMSQGPRKPGRGEGGGSRGCHHFSGDSLGGRWH